jgi:hypothetical protein
MFVNLFNYLAKGSKTYEPLLPRVAATHFTGRNIWIFKPSELNRGRGIQLFDSLKQFNSILKSYR